MSGVVAVPVVVERNDQCHTCAHGRDERWRAMVATGPCPFNALCRVQVEIAPDRWADAICDACIREWDLEPVCPHLRQIH